MRQIRMNISGTLSLYMPELRKTIMVYCDTAYNYMVLIKIILPLHVTLYAEFCHVYRELLPIIAQMMGEFV